MDLFSNYTRKCKDTQGGIKKVYLLPFVEYNETLITSVGMELTVFPTSVVYEYEVTGNYNQQSTTEQGNVFFTPTVTINLSKVYDVLDANAFIRNDFRVIVLTNNDQLIMFGTNNGMVCNMSNGSGTENPEFNGFALTFEGKEEKAGLLIDELSDFFTIHSDESTLVIAASQDATLDDFDGTANPMGQVFLLTGTITEIKLGFIVETGNPDYSIVAKVYDGDVTGETKIPTSPLLGTSTNAITSAWEGSDFTFTFAGTAVAGTVSVILVNENVVTHNNSNRWQMGLNSTNPYPNGEFIRSVAGGNWAVLSGWDFFMSITYI